jgi:hypothetical protein
MIEMFDEREAIYFEMQELKELGRREFDLYFEMRKHRNQRYSELQNRLRELDEIEYRRMSQSNNPVTDNTVTGQDGKVLPMPKNIDRTVTDLRTEPRETNNINKAKVDYVILTAKIESFLQSNGPQKSNVIRNYAEKEFGIKWANFNSTLKNILRRSDKVKVDTTSKQHIYYYDSSQ